MSDNGQIPQDWELTPLGSCLRSIPDYGINAAATSYSERLPCYIRITDITDDGRFSRENLVSVRSVNSAKYYLDIGDIVLARTGASVGKSYLYDPGDGPLVFAGFLIRVRTNPDKLLPRYLASLLITEGYWKWVNQNSMRSGQPGINSKEYAQLPIVVPPLTEQHAIVNALFDVDALIASLTKLLAKKRALKQAAMQRLLTGAVRLPGFSGEWETRRLGEIGTFAKGRGIRKDEVVSRGVPCIRYGEIYTRHHDYIRRFTSFIPRTLVHTTRRLRKGDLLFAASGETAEEIGKCVAFVGDEEAYVGSDIVVFSPATQHSLFLGYLMNSAAVVMQKSRMGHGDAVVHISARNLGDLRVTLPEHVEQTAIAAVLSDMDDEIAALEARLAKTRAIKQGMAQELLTGRTRLV